MAARKKNEDLGRLLSDLKKEKASLESKLKHYSSLSDPMAHQFENGYKQGVSQTISALDVLIKRYDYLVG